MKNRSSLIFTLLLVVGDAVAILAAYVLAYVVRVRFSDVPAYYNDIGAREFLLSLLILLPFIIILFSLIGTYSATRQSKIARISRIFFGAFGAMLFMIMIHYFMVRPIFPSKLVPIYGFVFSIIFLGAIRGVLYFARWFWRRRGLKRNIVLIGSGAKFRELYDLITSENSGFNLLATVSSEKFAKKNRKTFASAVRNFTPDIIIQIATREQPNLSDEIRDFAAANYVDLKFVPLSLSDADDFNPELFAGGILLMSVVPTKLTGWGRVAKRTFDFAFSLIALIIASPFMLIIWLILLCTDGKAIYRRERLTRFGKSFTIYKFRSMKVAYTGLDPEASFAKLGRPELIREFRANGDFLADDPRISRFGKFLRKTSLDELPQLFNVLRGDISLVGPRALIAEELNQSKHKNKILNVKSGLTGLAVVSGRKDLPFEQRRQLDAYYVQNWSFGLDLQIIAKTFWQVLTGRGAK